MPYDLALSAVEAAQRPLVDPKDVLVFALWFGSVRFGGRHVTYLGEGPVPRKETTPRLWIVHAGRTLPCMAVHAPVRRAFEYLSRPKTPSPAREAATAASTNAVNAMVSSM